MTSISEVTRDFQFVGEQRLERLSAVLKEILQPFVADWWRDTETLKMVDVCEFYTEASLYHEYRIYRNLRIGSEHIVFVGDRTVWHELFISLLEGESPENPQLEQLVLERFCLDFCQRLMGDEVVVEELTIDDHDESVNRYGSGCVALEVDVKGIPVSILLTRGIWKSCLGNEVAHSPRGVVPLNRALAPAMTKVEAYFHTNSVECGSIMDLQEGDFIPLGEDFTGSVTVASGALSDAFGAVLGRVGDNRAIKIT